MTDLPADPRNWNDDPVEGDAYLRPRRAGAPSTRSGGPEVPPKPVKVLPPEPVATEPVDAEPAPVVYDSLAALAPRSPARALVGPLLGVALVGVGLGFLLARTAGTSDANRTARTVVTPPPPLVATTARANVLGTDVRPTTVTTVTTTAAAAVTSAPATTAPTVTPTATPAVTPTTATPTAVTPPTTAPATPVVTVSPAPAAISGVDVAAPVRYAEFSGGKVFLHGRVPSAELRETIIRKVAAVVGPQNVFDDYVIDPATPPTAGGPLKVLDTIQFEPDSAVLRPAFTQILQLGVVLMNQNPAVRITVVGRSDSRGSADYNVELSQRRAAAVVGYFVGRGIDADRLTVEARGADDPLAPGDDDASLQANRSVEFIILGLID